MKRAGYLWIVLLAMTVAQASHADPPTAPSGTPRAAAFTTLPATISLDLKEARAPQVERALREALGMDVRLDGFLLRPVTLRLEAVPTDEALRQIAEAIGGSWRRVHSWTPGGDAESVLKPSGRKVSPRLTKAPCASAAAILAAAAGAWAEGHTKLMGRVSFDGSAIPLEEALMRIARASGASCRELMVLRTKAFEERERALAAKAREQGTDTGGKAKRPRRTRYTVLGKYGAKAPPPIHEDPEEIEARAQLGAFAGIFSSTDRAERLQRVRKLRASMETQNRRQDAYRPEHRVLAARFEVRHLTEMLADYEMLTDEQKKEVKVLVDYVRKRLAKQEALLASLAAKENPATE